MTCWCSLSFPPLNVGQYLCMVPTTSSSGFYTLFSLICLISFTNTTCGTTQTHMFSCLLTLLRRTSPHGKGLSLWVRMCSPPERLARRCSFHPAAGGRTAECTETLLSRYYLLCIPPFLDKNKNQTNKNIQKWFNPAMKICNIGISPLLSPANHGSCCFLLVYARIMCKICINDIPVFPGFVSVVLFMLQRHYICVHVCVSVCQNSCLRVFIIIPLVCENVSALPPGG